MKECVTENFGLGITISALKGAGIRVWVLTGDKQETAINIAYSCKLLSDELEQLIINDGDERVKTIDDKRKHISQQLSQYQDKVIKDFIVRKLMRLFVG